MSERRACKVLGQSRATQRRVTIELDDGKFIKNRIITLAKKYGRYGYRELLDLALGEYSSLYVKVIDVGEINIDADLSIYPDEG